MNAKNEGRARAAVAIACAAVDDVTAWCILAGVVLLVRASSVVFPLWLTLSGTVIYVALTLLVTRRASSRLATMYRARAALTQDLIGIIVLLVLASAWITERLGIHALFGAFLIGVIMPNAVVGSVTCAATTSGMRAAAYHAAAFAATADTHSINAIQTAGRLTRRAVRVPIADPIAKPPMNAAAIVANAYVVGPTTSASRRVQATS